MNPADKQPQPDTPDSPDLAWAVNQAKDDLAQLFANPQQHDLYQEGTFVKCRTPGHEHGHDIGPHMQLSKDTAGNWILTEETIVTPKGKAAKKQWRHLQRR